MTGTVLPLPSWAAWLTYVAILAYLTAPIWRTNRKDKDTPS